MGLLVALLMIFAQVVPVQGVDIFVDQPTLQNSVDIYTRTFAPTECSVVEGLISSAGTHKLLRFATETVNAGKIDLNMPRSPRANDPNYAYFPCHMHFHFLKYAEYRLKDGSGNVVGIGHKQSFCIEDVGIYYYEFAPHQNRPKYACYNQGLSSGWYDLYDYYLDGQWIEIDNVPPGTYTLEVEVNYARVWTESNYDNNVASVVVTIP
jgi:Lysyl oxidase.